MAYVIKEKGGSFYVVDTDTDRIRGKCDTEDDAEDRVDELLFRAEMRSGMSRIPNKELTADEKAAKYDEMMAKQKEDADTKVPGKKEDKTSTESPVDTKKKKGSLYWGQIED